MKKLSIIASIFTFIIAVALASPAHAEGQLFISPQRVDLNKKAAVGQLHLVNKSDSIKQYEIKIINYAMNEKGNLSVVEELPYSAKKFIRFSPRKVTLEAGEDQYVRVMARMPKTLEEGGYHTHIEFQEVQGAFNRKSDSKDLGEGNTSFKIASTYSVAIPIFVKNGAAEGAADLIAAKATVTKGASNGSVEVEMTRSGNDTTYNLVKIYYIDASGAKHIASTPAKIPVYREADNVKRKFQLSLPKGVVFNGGELQISLHELDSKEEEAPLDVVTATIQ